MHKTFTASRISEGNVLFPPTIIFDDNGVTVRCPFIYSGKSTYIPYSCISSVHIETPIIGFSTISFYAFGNQISIHGFLRSEAIQMRQIIIAHQR
ncbi:MAG: hypothetical protein IJP44_12150 [Bacteroidales bacterium]|nr:hypothetical protein [Bacteroidales bacterium]